MGTCYLLCFRHKNGRKAKLKHAGHYIGWSLRPKSRLWHHRRGTSGVKILQAARKEGIKFRLAREWTGTDRHFERYLKNRKEATRMCPLCNGGNAWRYAVQSDPFSFE